MPESQRESASRPLYVFLDESGNFDFSTKGTDYFIVSAVITSDPLAVATPLTRLKYELLAEGMSEVRFHAAENAQPIRDRVYNVINGSLADAMSSHTMYLDKHLAAPAVQDEVKMMALIGKAMARWLEYRLEPIDGPIIIAFDSVLTRRQQAAFKSEVKPVLKELGRGFNLTFQPVKEEPCGQVADYIAWAWSRHFERGDGRPLAQFKNVRQSDFNLFRWGHKRYY